MTHEEFRAVLDAIHDDCLIAVRSDRPLTQYAALVRIHAAIARARAKLDAVAVENCR